MSFVSVSSWFAFTGTSITLVRLCGHTSFVPVSLHHFRPSYGSCRHLLGPNNAHTAHCCLSSSGMSHVRQTFLPVIWAFVRPGSLSLLVAVRKLPVCLTSASGLTRNPSNEPSQPVSLRLARSSPFPSVVPLIFADSAVGSIVVVDVSSSAATCCCCDLSQQPLVSLVRPLVARPFVRHCQAAVVWQVPLVPVVSRRLVRSRLDC